MTRFLYIFFCFSAFWPTNSLIAKKITQRLTPQLKVIYHVSNQDSAIKNGQYEEYFENKLLVKGFYKNNLKNGEWNWFYKSGKTKISAFFENDKKQGTWNYFYENSNQLANINFKRGLKTGTWVAYNVEGEKTSIANYLTDTLFGEQVQYHPNGEIASYTIIEIKNGLKQKVISKYYENSKLFESYTLRGSFIEGNYLKYHNNGLVWEAFLYENEKLITVKKMQNSTGKKLFIGSFREGNGELRRYHGDGTLYSEENFNNGLIYGKAKYFIDNILRVEGFYFKGKPLSNWKYYSQYKKLKEERTYFGKEDYQYVIEYGVSGEERNEGEVLNNMKTGTWKAYNFYGDLASITDYKFNEKNGEFKRYDGQILLEKGGYFYGEKVGRWRTFNKSDKIVYEEIFSKSVSFDTTLVNIEQKPIKPEPSSYYNFTPEIKTHGFASSNLTEDEYINQFISLPPEANALNIKGTIISQLQINEFGNIENIKLQRGIGFGCDEEVIRVLNLLPHYEPALLNGLPKETILVKEFTFGEDF